MDQKTQTAEEILSKEKFSEYLLVTDKTSKIILSTTDYKAVTKQARLIRSAGGEVSIFKKLES